MALKMFHSIVLLNILGKLIEKAIGERLQIFYDFKLELRLHLDKDLRRD